MKASDSLDDDGQFSVASVTVYVPRDKSIPVFREEYSKTILETLPANSSVLAVEATDQDVKVRDFDVGMQYGVPTATLRFSSYQFQYDIYITYKT